MAERTCEKCGSQVGVVLCGLTIPDPRPKGKPFTLLRDLCPECRGKEQERVEGLAHERGAGV